MYKLPQVKLFMCRNKINVENTILKQSKHGCNTKEIIEKVEKCT